MRNSSLFPFSPKPPAIPKPPFLPPAIPEAAKRVDPGVLLITLLDDMTQTLESIRGISTRMEKFLAAMEAQMQRVPKGVVETFDDITVTSGEQRFDTVTETEQKWYSATIYNRGPDSIQVRANDGLPSERAAIRALRKARYTTLDEGEFIDVDFRAPLLQHIYYKLAAGSSSALMKIVGEW